MGEMMVSYGGSLYGLGGRDFEYVNLDKVYRYNPGTDSWTQMAAMPQPRNWAGAAEASGHIYVVDGSNDGGALNTVFQYDIATNSWATLPNTLAATYGPAVVGLNNDIYRIGGLDPQGIYTTSVELLGQGFVAPLPLGLAWPAAVALNGYIYVAGGSHDGLFGTKTYRYDPETDTWSDDAIADLPEGKASSASGVLNGHFVVAGGGNDYSTAFEWDPATNVWSALPPLLYPRFNMAGGVVGDTMYVVGGVNFSKPDAVNQGYATSQCASPTITPTAIPTQQPSPTSTATTCVLGDIPDLPPDSTFYPYARCLLCRGIMSLYPCGGPGEPCQPPWVNGYFRPSALSTRGQLAKVVSLAAGFDDNVSGQTFEDVVPGSTFYVYIERMSERQLISGYPCGGTGEPCGPLDRPYFRPGANTTRGQLTKLVSNAANFTDPPVGQTFEDVPPGATFYTFTERLSSRNIMSGYPCGSPGEPCEPPEDRPYFRPGNNVTRGQTAKIVANAFLPACDTP
jgi:N-acetylneuraminic acid mutarotase